MMAVEEVDDDRDPFEGLLPPPPPRKKARNGKRIIVQIRSLPPPATAASDPEAKVAAAAVDEGTIRASAVREDFQWKGGGVTDFFASYLDSDDEETEIERAMSFYQETHEDQDPAFQQIQRESKISALQKKLLDIDDQDARSRAEIDEFIRQQIDDRQRSTSQSLEKYRVRADADQKRSLQRLQQIFEQKAQSNQQRIHKGIQMLRDRHAKEIQALQQRLQQQGQQVNFPQLQAQLTSKSQRQLAEFSAKGEELKKKTESEYKAEIEKIRGSHGARLIELSSNRKKILEKLMMSFQQVRQRYMKRHLQRVMKRKERILEAIQELKSAGSPNALAASSRSRSMTQAGRLLSPISSPSRSPLRASTTATASALSVGGDGGALTVTATTTTTTTSVEEDKAEFRQPSPIKSMQPWARELFDHHSLHTNPVQAGRERAGASARHKHRKAISGQVTRQLSIEIHNEGLWVSIQQQDDESSKKLDGSVSNPGSADNPSTNVRDEEFLVWGTRARSVLESITCGEIPASYDRILLDASDAYPSSSSLSSQGGQVRCVVTDLRTSEETASEQRATAAREFDATQIADLEKKCKDLLTRVNEAEVAVAKLQEKEKEGAAAVESASSDVAKAKRMQDEFLAKFRNYIGADGNVVDTTNANDREELKKALRTYKTNFDNMSRRENAARAAVMEIQSRIQKFQLVSKASSKSLVSVTELLRKRKLLKCELDTSQSKSSLQTIDQERASVRVKDVIACFRKAAEKRREQMNDKKSGNVSNAWVQSFPDLPTSLKKSLWHKMHRRKQQIVLRPSAESMTNQLRSAVIESRKALHERHATTLEEDLIRAEKIFLLATHPHSTTDLSAVPLTKAGETWAEPGWHLALDVPNYLESDRRRILPCFPSFPVLEKNLSEVASAPGRQAASFLKQSHFRCLSLPLSTVSIASSPSESGGTIPMKGPAEGDPLHLSEESLSIGYTFSLIKPSPAKAAQVRRKSGNRDAAALAESSARKMSVGAPAAELAGQRKDARTKPASSEHPRDQGKGEAKRRRSTKSLSDSAVSRPRKNPSVLDHSGSNKMKDSSSVPPSDGPREQQRQDAENQSVGAAAVAHAAAAAAAHYSQYMQQVPPQHSSTTQHQMAAGSHHQHIMQTFVQQNQSRHANQGSQQSQFSSNQQRQLAQLRMMQQQQQQVQSPHRQHVPPNYSPHAVPIQQQFFNPLNHPGTPGRSQLPPQPPNIAGMHMQGRPAVPMQRQTLPNPSPPSGGQQPAEKQGSSESNQNDPLFMLK